MRLIVEPGRRALRLGLTGSFGSGKSTVARMMAEEGVAVIDADRLAREVVAPGQPALAEIAREFGTDLLAPDGSLKRRELAERVFGDREATERLNRIVHPRVRERELALLEQWRDRPLVVLDVPLLIEAGMSELVDRVVLVVISEAQRFFRLKCRGYGEREIVRRLGMQMPQSRKRRYADDVIDNSGKLETTREQVHTLLERLQGVLRSE